MPARPLLEDHSSPAPAIAITIPVRLIGLVLLALVGVAMVSLASWNVDDPSFSYATGEPASGKTDMLPVRNGVLAIEPETNGPLAVRGNLEITSGTGRVVARVVSARLCRCGGSSSKPFCDGTHSKLGFQAAEATLARTGEGACPNVLC